MKTEVTWLEQGEVRIRLIPQSPEEIRLVKALQQKEPGGQRWQRDLAHSGYGTFPQIEEPGELVIYLHDPVVEVPDGDE